MRRLFIDHTKTSSSGHISGLNRVNLRISEELESACPQQVFRVKWSRWRRTFVSVETGAPVRPTAEDSYLVAEAFDPQKLWRWQAAVKQWPGQTYAIFHDNIPGTHPELCFPHVVKRHPAYLQALTNFNQVLSVSKASLLELKKAIGDTCPPAKVIQLGADYSGIKEGNTCLRKERLEQLGQKVSALMVGIVEPRKNQLAALEAQRILAEQGITLELTIVGRLNDHFGEAIKQKIEKQIREGYPCRYVGAVADSQLDELYTQADVLLFPSIVEGFGLPPFEALARGVPCISHRLPSVFEFLEDAPIIWCDAPTGESLAKGISRFANDLEFRKNFPEKAQSFHLPKWKDTALQIAEITGLSE